MQAWLEDGGVGEVSGGRGWSPGGLEKLGGAYNST